MTSVRTSARAAGESPAGHPDPRLAGTAAAARCSHCGSTFHGQAADVLVVESEEDLVARRAAARAHELELERAQHTPEASRLAPVSAREASAHRRTLAEVMSR